MDFGAKFKGEIPPLSFASVGMTPGLIYYIES